MSATKEAASANAPSEVEGETPEDAAEVAVSAASAAEVTEATTEVSGRPGGLNTLRALRLMPDPVGMLRLFYSSVEVCRIIYMYLSINPLLSIFNNVRARAPTWAPTYMT